MLKVAGRDDLMTRTLRELREPRGAKRHSSLTERASAVVADFD